MRRGIRRGSGAGRGRRGVALTLLGDLGMMMTDGTAGRRAKNAVMNHVARNATDDGAAEAAGVGRGDGKRRCPEGQTQRSNDKTTSAHRVLL